jgi:hypothetical protein
MTDVSIRSGDDVALVWALVAVLVRHKQERG